MKPALVSIITVNLNGKYLLGDWFASLASQSYSRFEVIFVDNHSRDDSCQVAKKLWPKIKMIENQRNLGFPQGCNQGAALAQGKYLFFLNNDAQPDRFCLNRLVAFLRKHPRTMAVGPAIFQKDKKRLESAGFFPTLSGFVIHLTKLLTSKPFQVFGVSGAAMLVRKQAFDLVGGFDPDFFLYSEDIDLCTRLRTILAGRIWVLPQAKVYHLRGETTKKARKWFVVYHATKNRPFWILKNFSFPLLWLVLPIHFCLLLAGIVFFLILRKKDRAKAMMRAVSWNLRNLSLIWRKRNKVQARRQVSDWVLFEKFFKPFPARTILRVALNYLKEW